MWIVFCVLLISTISARSLYDLLGVTSSATDDEIRRSFKKLARAKHPDVANVKTDQERDRVRKEFIAISEAYEILIDDRKRKIYDESGSTRAPQEDRNYLRHRLFSSNFEGEEVGATEVLRYKEGHETVPHFVMFWSSNYPECIEAGVAFKAFAAKLKGSSLAAESVNCGNQMDICRYFGFRQLPASIMFPAKSRQHVPFTGKYDVESLSRFSMDFLSLSTDVVVSASPETVDAICPWPHPPHVWPGLFFSPMLKKCYTASVSFDLVSFEYSPCHDCLTEIKLALDYVTKAVPGMKLCRINCNENIEFCELFNTRASRNRAWGIASFRKTCWYAMKRPLNYSDEICNSSVTVFNGKYAHSEIAMFVMRNKKSFTRRLTPSMLSSLKLQRDAYAVLYYKEADENMMLQWKLVARQLHNYPVQGKKGDSLFVATMKCEADSMCADAKGMSLPVILLYGYGTKVKKLRPVAIHMSVAASMIADIVREAEPLHLHVLGPKNYDEKINGGLSKGKHWFVLYNAGEWCPPCNQIRPEWQKLARIIQNTPSSQKLSIGLVECDTHRSMCGSLNIGNFPSMAFLAKGRPRLEYNGNRDAGALAEWATNMIDNRLLSMSIDDIQHAIRLKKSILISFTAGSWCPPCTQLGPIFKKAANKLGSSAPNLPVTALDCDEARYGCRIFGIDGFPTIVLYSKGARHEYEGSRTVDEIARWAMERL